MTIDVIGLEDGRTTIEIDTQTGILTERGASFPVLHRSATDAMKLLELLTKNKAIIQAAAQKEQNKTSIKS